MITIVPRQPIEPGRSAPSRFTFDAGTDVLPVLSPAGNQLVFASNRTFGFGLYLNTRGEAGTEAPLTESDYYLWPTSWSKDGRVVVYSGGSAPKFKSDIWQLRVSEPDKPTLFLQTPFNETDGVLSSDGGWIAYASDQSGRYEVYVQPFPAGGRPWQVSQNGGRQPRWRGDGTELFFMTLEGDLMSAAVESATPTGFKTAAAKRLFETNARPILAFSGLFVYDVTKDGQKFLINRPPVGDLASSTTSVVVNWSAKLSKR
jgi:Tol biopolymer transport system component